MPRFIPNLNATIAVTDLVTALLLFAQFSIYRSRALLVLAGGYLFSAFIVIPHALTFPGAFSPTGLLGAGFQTAAWLYVFWHLGLPVALVLYALLKDEAPSPQAAQRPIGLTIAACISITFGLMCALVWLTTVGGRFMPSLFSGPSELTALGRFTPAAVMTLSVFTLVLLWIRRRSVLDLWLMVVACALIGELALTVVRFSLGFYVSRVFSLVTSTVVLFILVAETTRLYARLAHSLTALRRERNNKLMNIAAVVASIAHEVRQPLTAIVMRADSASRDLERVPPDLDRAQVALDHIVADGQRISQTFDNIRDLFKTSEQGRVPLDLNDLAMGALTILRDDLSSHRVGARTALMGDPPPVMGHRGQLQEVLLNLIRNAIEAMDSITIGARTLCLKTEWHGNDAVAVVVEDSGPGIAPEKLDSIFDAFMTTKSKGMGLGLAICRMIAERHGGRLEASTVDKRGARFQMILPVTIAPVRAEGAA
ncbi:MAG TPA: MASE4 domain-containing protein [Pseudolabrys sp.]|nr:MASE4 domain-containing protein [Pseudolabrys sp.]